MDLRDFTDLISSAIAKDDDEATKNQYWIRAKKKLSYGFYKVTGHSNTQFVLEKNPYHPNADSAYFEKIIYNCAPLKDGLEQFTSGKIDVLMGPIGKQKHWILKTYGDKTMDVGSPRIYFLLPDRSKANYASKKLMQALFLALDRKTFAKSLFGSKNSFLESNVPFGTDGYPSLDFGDFESLFPDRLEKAKAIIKALGYSKENPLKLKLGVANVPGYSAIGGFIKGSWKAINVEVEIIQNIGFYDMLKQYSAGDFDFVIGSYIEQNSSVIQYLSGVFEYAKISGTSVPKEYMRLRKKALLSRKKENYVSALHELDRYILEEKLIIPIAANSATAIFSEKIINIKKATSLRLPRIFINELKLDTAK